LQASGQAAEAHRRHIAYYRSLAETGAITRRGARYPGDLEALAREHNNTRAALTNALALGDLEDGLALCHALGGFWLSQGLLNEGQEWFKQFLDRADDLNWEVVVDSLFSAGRIAEYRGAFDLALNLHQRSLPIARRHEDVARTARALYGLGDAALHQGDYGRAEQCLEEGISLGRSVAVSSGLAEALASFATVADARGEHDRASERLEEAVEIQRRIGDNWGVAFVLNELGQRARRQGQLDRAQSIHEESHRLWRQSGSRMGERAALMNLTLVSLDQGRIANAVTCARSSLGLCHEMSDASATTTRCVEIAARVLQACGSSDIATSLVGAASSQRETLGAPVPRSEQPELDGLLNATRGSLEVEDFQHAWEAGSQLSIDEAVELATKALAAMNEVAPR
jgi:tetratricopeptide (TPR) repeat protein